MRKIFFVIIILLFNVGLVYAHEHNFAETKQLIDSGISCNELTDEQLEVIGDYYMEQMHPDEAHEMMDKMMGGEGSDSLKKMHIQMATRLYCDEDVAGKMGGSMMNMMMSSGGMMNMMGTNMMGGSFGGSSWWLWSVVGWLFWIALLVALILLIIWLYKQITGQVTNDGSIEILKKRFAKGEITKKEFESMKKNIR